MTGRGENQEGVTQGNGGKQIRKEKAKILQEKRLKEVGRGEM